MFRRWRSGEPVANDSSVRGMSHSSTGRVQAATGRLLLTRQWANALCHCAVLGSATDTSEQGLMQQIAHRRILRLRHRAPHKNRSHANEYRTRGHLAKMPLREANPWLHAPVSTGLHISRLWTGCYCSIGVSRQYQLGDQSMSQYSCLNQVHEPH